jgi:glucosyl-3-phosphoglycerate synthase
VTLVHEFFAEQFDRTSLRDRDCTVSVIVPTRNVASSLPAILEVLVDLKEDRVIDEVLVVDANSTDGTRAVVQASGATLRDESAILPNFGPSLGKGDALWRGLSATTGDIVIFIDSDTQNFDERFILGLLGPLVVDPDVQMVKGAFKRPHVMGDQVFEDEGGRVTELVARPLINLYFPELACFAQPLAGEMAARRSLLEEMSFPVGYGVELGNLIDASKRVGIGGLAQVWLGSRIDAHQKLFDLVPMGSAVAYAALVRADALSPRKQVDVKMPRLPGGTTLSVSLEERPPIGSLLAREN